MAKSLIRLCPNHEPVPVPLIYTFAFPGAEYWCPACGYTEGIFGQAIEVPHTMEMGKQLQKWEEKSKEFLAAKGSLVCSSLIFNGRRIKPSELPAEELKRRRDIVNAWKYKIEL